MRLALLKAAEKQSVETETHLLGSKMFSNCSAYTFCEAVKTTTSNSCATRSKNSNRKGRCLTATECSLELNLTTNLKSATSFPSKVECTCITANSALVLRLRMRTCLRGEGKLS